MISIPAYLSRLFERARPPSTLILAILFFVDRLSAMDETFVLDSLTAHRFLLASVVVICKGLSDTFLTNRDYARIGGVSLTEINHLEREFLWRVDWRIVVHPEVLGEYYRALLARSGSKV